ncbi:MAG: methyltransferase [Deltaproteobacteria bacterium]|nr:methyltransferase [Deltaproteobacteria bacterium]
MKPRQARVGYTYFLREPRALELVVASLPEDRESRLWCAGCATGEEAYSYALLASERGRRTQVLATDFDAGAVEAAREAIYGERAVRRVDARRRRVWFERQGERFRVTDPARSSVQLRMHDLLEPLEEAPPGGFDVISCRNVLLYLEPEDIERALRRLRSSLAPGGFVVLGAAERISSEILRRVGLVGSLHEGATLFHAGAGPGLNQDPTNLGPGQRSGSSASGPDRQRSHARRNRAPAERRVLDSKAPDESGRVSELRARGDAALDVGDFEGATRAFRLAIELEPLTPDLHLRLGLARLSAEDREAARAALKRALFFEPRLWPAALILADLVSYEESVRYLRLARAGLETAEELPRDVRPFAPGRRAALEAIERRLRA